MSDKHDIHLRKIEIAWEIARAALEGEKEKGGHIAAPLIGARYVSGAKEHLGDAWSVVDSTLPTDPEG